MLQVHHRLAPTHLSSFIHHQSSHSRHHSQKLFLLQAHNAALYATFSHLLETPSFHFLSMLLRLPSALRFNFNMNQLLHCLQTQAPLTHHMESHLGLCALATSSAQQVPPFHHCTVTEPREPPRPQARGLLPRCPFLSSTTPSLLKHHAHLSRHCLKYPAHLLV